MLKFSRLIAFAVSLPVLLWEYFSPEVGMEYGVGFFSKLRLLLQMANNRRKIQTASDFIEHLVMATQILKVPASIEGAIVECGCFKGGSTANLSLVCSLCDRKLEVFDSFAGLPEPSEADLSHLLVGSATVHTYSEGAYRGSLLEVKSNITNHGAIDVCTFHPGFFEQTLPSFHTKCALVFVDVDLVDSLRTCCRYLWPLLQDNCCLFTHEAHHMEIARVFFDQQWWHDHVSDNSPGLIGAGSGLGLLPFPGGFRSALGYTVKAPRKERFTVEPQTCGLSVGD
jgi:O-methyltransferase